MKEETITLMIDDGKCYIPLESLNNVVCNTLFELLKQQQEQINTLTSKIIKINKERD